MTPLRPKASISAGPASPAAIPVSTKIPAPTIAPTPMSVASAKPIPRLSLTSGRRASTRCDKESLPLRADFAAAHSTTLAAAKSASPP